MRKFSLAIIMLISGSVFADDPGITKVRLIQETDRSYSFEVDISRSLLWTIKAPILPDRFQVSDVEYENQSGWITLKAKITTNGEPLSNKDEIVLPWTRNGVDISVQWKDGKTFKGFFNRTLDGIHIPLKELMPVQKTMQEVFLEGFQLGVRHLSFSFVHLLLIFVLIWAIPKSKILRYLLVITLGQMVAMILVELDLPGFDLLLSDLLFILIIFLISYSVVYKIEFKHLDWLLFFSGVIHGLSFANEINVVALSPIQEVQSLFAFNLAMDLGHYVFALVAILIVSPLQKRTDNSRWFPIASGALSIFLIFHIYQEHLLLNEVKILDLQTSPAATTYKSSVKSPAISTRQAQRGTGLMSTPLMVYLSVEPFEVRQEILVQAATVNQYLSLNTNSAPIIPIESQEQLKKELQEVVTTANTIYVNNQRVTPADIITNFVTLGRGGVAIREDPIEENLETAILGITFVYEVETFPDSILVDWQLFPDLVRSIEASAVDPHGAFTTMLTPEEHTMQWKSRLVGYQVPAIKAIEVEKRPKPVISFLLGLGFLLFVVYHAVYKRASPIRQWIVIMLLMGFVTYPFVRFKIDLPLIPGGQPSSERTSVILNDLLTNVYRAFERRNENDVYDRLALSVSGNQLTEIYIQNRQSMALESRGGARANVDDVNIQELFDIDRDENGGYVADTKWTVRGSVNHFGHTHYRQNQYRALVSFGIDNGHWKINDIEILYSKRLY